MVALGSRTWIVCFTSSMGCIPTFELGDLSGIRAANAWHKVELHPMEGCRFTRYAAVVINKPHENMSYPMNEFVSDLENAEKTAEDWIATSAATAGTALHGAGDGITAAMERGRDFYKALARRVGKEANAANAVMHRNPYPTVLVGIGAGALLGFLFACRRNCGAQ